MEHEDNNAQFDNFLQNRLAESLQMAAGAGQVADVAGDLMVVPPQKSDEQQQQHDEDDEEWKYIQEVQQSEKHQQQLQQQQQLQLDDELHHDLSLNLNLDPIVVGNGRAAAPPGAIDYEEGEEDEVEVIKNNDNDFSTNSNTETTTSTGEIKEKDNELIHPLVGEQFQQQQLEQHHEQQQHHEDEDEPSSVATTCGTTSSLSEHQPAPQYEGGFDNKENNDPFSAANQSPLALNPNAMEFVPNFGSQPTSPSPIPESHINPHQLIAGGVNLDDLVAESPRKGSNRVNMDAINVPDELEFDNEAAKRPHELEQADDVFGQEQQQEELQQPQLLNGAGDSADIILDHGPETSVDLDAPATPTEEDVMNRSLYAEHNNASAIEDILNSVQPLPINTQLDDEFAEKELLHVEEKEHISQSPSTEELQEEEEEHQQQQPEHQLFAAQDPMQASFYLEHTSSENQDPFNLAAADQLNQSLLLDTSAPLFSPEAADSTPVTKLELEPQEAAVVDITPSPLSSTEEKHLVEETKEQEPLEEQEYQKTGTNLIQEQALLEHNDDGPLEFTVGAPPQVEEYTALSNAAADFVDNLSSTLESNPFAASLEKEIVNKFTLEPESQPSIGAFDSHLEEPPISQLQDVGVNYNPLELQEELIEETHHFTNGVESHITPEPPVHVEQEVEKVLHFDIPEQQEPPKVEQEPEPEPEKELLHIEAPAAVQEQEPIPEPVPEEPIVAVTQSLIAEEEPPKVAEPEPLAEPLISSEPIKDEPVVAAEPTVEAPVVAAVAAAGAVAAVAAAAVVAKPKIGKTSPTEAKKPAAAPARSGVTATKAKPATTSAAKKPLAAAPSKTSTAAARPRTAPATGAAAKPASTVGAAAKPATAARKPLTSTLAAKPGPKTTTTGASTARPATAPVSKTTAPTATRSAPTTARKPISSTTTTSSAAQVKPRLAATSAAAGAPKPKVPSPKSTLSSTLRKTAAPTSASSTTSTSARSPTKALANGVAKSSVGGTATATHTTRVRSATTTGATNGSSTSTTTTTTTTTTKTFTARPAPKFTHSVTGPTAASTARRTASSTGVTAAAQRKSSPLKTTTRSSPLKPLGSANNSPLKPKAKESATTKTSPTGLKGKGAAATPIKATNGVAKQQEQQVQEPVESEATHNGNGNGNGILHDDTEELHQPQDSAPVAAADVALLDF
ncbi:205 kDa microtubule-associated protein [Drosophila willistoni]|uniref:205 kDa microtubule-associated protein n=1 Tax=Drosophila willistoni TaxID=7260 RepID=UPI00017D89B7|nr:205 kDa microtubule-associated protein [Drosophila willistoni]